MESGDDLGATVVDLTSEDLGPEQRRRLLVRLIEQTRSRGIGNLFRPRSAVRWMADVVSDMAPRLPVRDLATLRCHQGGLDGEALAERLVRNAARATAGLGAAGGGIATIEWAATPTLLSAPVLLAAETIGVVAIELKLVGELHEVYRTPIRGVAAQRAMAMIHSWAAQRAASSVAPGVGVGTLLGATARRELRENLLRRFGRNLTTLGPFLTGAAVASYLNHRATRSLGEQLRGDLRVRARNERIA